MSARPPEAFPRVEDSPRVASYLRCERLLAFLTTGLRALHQGLWLGILDRRNLVELTLKDYGSGSCYASPIHVGAGFFGWETAALERFFSGRRSILVAAAGAGREMLAFARQGICVDGFDCSADLLAAGRQILERESAAGVGVRLLLAPPDGVPEELATYDGVVVGYAAYSHIVGRGARTAFLRHLGGHLRDDAPLLVSFFTRARRARQHRVVFAVARWVRWLRRNRDPLELGDLLLSSFEHCFTRDELEDELREAGFSPVYFEEAGFPCAVAVTTGAPSGS